MHKLAPAKPINVLVVADEPNTRRMLVESMRVEGHRVRGVDCARDAMLEAARGCFDVAFVHLRLGNDSGVDLIQQLIADNPWMKVIAIRRLASIDTAVEATKRGAFDFISKPFTPAHVRRVVERSAKPGAFDSSFQANESGADESDACLEIGSNSAGMRRALEVARQVACTEASVLIRGEIGTGKGMLAKAIHGWSRRAPRRFATISCRALSLDLLESELFGHVKGTFTGAERDSIGRIAAAEGGTVFLDDIGDLPLTLQPKLVRLIQEREYECVGDSVTRHANVRLIAATSVDLGEAVKAGRFREDLFYRIKVIDIDVPPLRERREDILPLARRMLVHFGRQRISGFTDDAVTALVNYAWPGNVRELRNVIERAVILCGGNQIGIEHVPSNFATVPAEPRIGDPVSFEQLEATHLRRVIASTDSMISAARALGINQATLWRKRRKLGI